MTKTHLIVKAIILDEAENVLLLRRSSTHPTLAYAMDLPGGMVDPGEEPGQSMRREIAEETGIQFASDDLRVIYATSHLIHGINYPRIIYTGVVKGICPDITISWEHDMFEWVPFDRVAEAEPDLKDTYKQLAIYLRDHDIL